MVFRNLSSEIYWFDEASVEIVMGHPKVSGNAGTKDLAQKAERDEYSIHLF